MVCMYSTIHVATDELCYVQGDVGLLHEFGSAYSSLSSYLETVVTYLTLRSASVPGGMVTSPPLHFLFHFSLDFPPSPPSSLPPLLPLPPSLFPSFPCPPPPPPLLFMLPSPSCSLLSLISSSSSQSGVRVQGVSVWYSAHRD